jgi:membrane protein DedA with SNARE-associated domain
MFHQLMLSLLPYSYVIVFLTIFLEGFGMPVPGEAILITGSILAAKGKLSFPLVLLAGVLGAVLGNSVGYLIGVYSGKKVLNRFAFFRKNFDKFLASYCKWGGLIVVLGRFFQGLRQLNGFIAGIAEMKWKVFLLFNVIGAILWVCAWGSFSYLTGRETHAIARLLQKYQLIFVVALLLLLAFYLFWKLTLEKKTRTKN